MCFTFTRLIIRGRSDGIIWRFKSQPKEQERHAEGVSHKKQKQKQRADKPDHDHIFYRASDFIRVCSCWIQSLLCFNGGRGTMTYFFGAAGRIKAGCSCVLP